MKFFLASLIAVFFVSSAQGAGFVSRTKKFSGYTAGTWGLGLLAGEPSGARAVYFTGWKQAWSLSTGYSFLNKTVVGSLDYLFYFYSAQDRRVNDSFWNSLLFYLGGGVLGGAGVSGSDPNDSYQVGVRGIAGAEYVITTSPWSLLLEVAPQLYFKAKNSFGVSVVIGMTYHFGGRDSARVY
jgi:hypothetical protein